MIVSFQRLDFNVTFGYFWNSPDFVMYNPDGSKSDYETAKKTALDVAGSVADFKTSWNTGTIRVLTKDLAICTIVGKADITFKSGDKMKEDPDVYTWIFKKIDGQWKVIYSHESGVPVMQKATTK
jgi:ketosteroid isomerase-like protein